MSRSGGSTVLIGGHAGASKPVILGTGEQRILPLFELHACGREQDVTLDGVEPVTIIGEGATVDGFWLLPIGIRLNAQGQEALPAQARAVPPGDRIEAGRPRQLVVRLVGTGAGDYIFGSVRLSYHTGAPGVFTFATQITVYSGACSGDESRASPTGWTDPLALRVQAVLDTQVNPGVAAHGGYIDLLEVRDGTA